MLTTLPSCSPKKPGSSGLPSFGIEPAVLDDNGLEIEGPAEGHLVIKKPWPVIARTFCDNHGLYEQTYFQKFPGYYWTGDAVRRDSDGYYFITGRIDDTIKVSGVLLSLVEIEVAIEQHRAVGEVCVVSAPHSVKGEVPFVFVVLIVGFEMNPELKKELEDQGCALYLINLFTS